MKTKLQIIFFLCVLPLTGLIAQTIPQKDSLPDLPLDSLRGIRPDSIRLPGRPAYDPTRAFPSPTASRTDSIRSQIKYSDDALDEPLDYNARDSQWIDGKNQVVYLYGAAEVKYEKLVLKADYIVLDLKDNIATAEGLPDSLGKMSGTPEFDDGSQQFSAKRLRYNFKSGKGIIYDGTTKQNDLYLLGSRSKYIAKDEEKKREDDNVFTSGAILTTCNHPNPHFGIRSKRIKVVPDKVAIVGPSNLEIAGVATPIVLPFGFFPISDQPQTGLLQGDFDVSQTLGFGLQNWGWYFPLSDRYDLELRGDIYSRGTYRLNGRLRYKKRYKYNGSFNLRFSDIRRLPSGSIEAVHDRSFGIDWQHNQDPNAHPRRTFSGTLRFQTNDYQSTNLNDPDAALENIISSNLNYDLTFPDKPYTFSASFSHSQNTATRRVQVDFPNLNFQVQTLYPFRRKKSTDGEEKWFEKIGLRYTSRMQNTMVGTDTTFFTQQTLEEAQVGVKHDVDLNANFNVLKYFTLSPSINYDESWYFNYLEKEFDPTLTIDSMPVFLDPSDKDPAFYELDTVGYGNVEDIIKYGFRQVRLFNANINLTTRIFGTLLFKKGALRGLRHVMTPRIGLTFTPDYTRDFFNYYRTVDTDVRPDENVPLQYSIFERNIFDRPNDRGRVMNLTYGIKNLFEGKYYSKKDSTEKKFKILNNIDLDGSYNFAADSVKFSEVRFNGSGNFFRGLTRFSFTMVLDPHAVGEDGMTRINKSWFSETGRFLRFVNANFTFSNDLSFKKIKELIRGKEERQGGEAAANRNGGSRGGPPGSLGQSAREPERSFLSWFEDFTISHEFRLGIERLNDGSDTILIRTNNIRARGSLQLTKNWRLDIRNLSYDLKSGTLTYPSLGFSRNLHCWEMNMLWTPSRNTYTFTLRVKPGSLGFLSVPWKRNNQDGRFR
ncbi:MAG: putative LPS assembly protein LptD [Bacteroidota bacterium]